MRLNRYGAIVAEEWQRTAELRRNVILDEFVVMPNHFHGIVVLKEAGMARHAPTGVFGKPQAQALPAVVGAFKSAVTRRINHGRVAHQLAPVRVWQRNYYERIIRDEKELNQTRRYILENPLCWVKDEENPDNQL
jgi:REP element-mobilizing transposase RayT